MTTAAAHQAEPEPPERTDTTAAPAPSIVEGKSLGTVEILFVRDGKTYLKYKLFDATVSSLQVGGSPGGEGKPTETWALHPETIEVAVDSPGGGGSVRPVAACPHTRSGSEKP